MNTASPLDPRRRPRLADGADHLTINNPRSADLITAGRIVPYGRRRARPRYLLEHCAGGGGNFGIVVWFEYDFVSVDTVLKGIIIYGLDRQGEGAPLLLATLRPT